ncbi:MAG: NifU family protein [Candidatus Altiarchaeota archaeon]|nr:NifU family protein [Candidatus Altiarchaeota archaeon]
MGENVEKTLGKIREVLKADGGDIELVGIDEVGGIVKVKFKGACAGCPFAHMTLKNFVEAYLKKNVEGIQRVESV